MLTTGFKLFFGYFIAAMTAAALFGYTSGGNHLGPVTAGYKGSVGNHVGYVILLSAGLMSGMLAAVTIAFRDADAKSQAEVVGLDTLPAQRPVPAGYWPIGAAIGAGAVVMGLVLSSAVFVVGLVILAIVIFEWMVQAWADRATGDPEANRQLRDRVMAPIEVPVLALAAAGLLILSLSRVLLAVNEHAAVWVAIGVAGLIMLSAIMIALRPRVSRNVVAAVVVLIGLGIITGGIVSASIGERKFHPEEHPSAPHVGPPTTTVPGK